MNVPPADGEPALPALPPPSPVPVGTLSPDGMHYWDGSRWFSCISPDGLWNWNAIQWVQRQVPQQFYQYPQQVYVHHSSGGAAKGCLIASGVAFTLLGLFFLLTLIGFFVGLVCIVIGIVMIVVGAVSR